MTADSSVVASASGSTTALAGGGAATDSAHLESLLLEQEKRLRRLKAEIDRKSQRPLGLCVRLTEGALDPFLHCLEQTPPLRAGFPRYEDDIDLYKELFSNLKAKKQDT